jgi:hypothetical protein
LSEVEFTRISPEGRDPPNTVPMPVTLPEPLPDHEAPTVDLEIGQGEGNRGDAEVQLRDAAAQLKARRSASPDVIARADLDQRRTDLPAMAPAEATRLAGRMLTTGRRELTRQAWLDGGAIKPEVAAALADQPNIGPSDKAVPQWSDEQKKRIWIGPVLRRRKVWRRSRPGARLSGRGQQRQRRFSPSIPN